MSKYTISEIISEISATRQVIPTEKLVKWLENFGFEIRNTGGSHVFVSHKAETDIYDTLIRNTGKLSTQRAVRVMFQKLNERSSALTQEFKKSSLSPEFIAETLEQKVPADLEYRLTESGNIVLTDRAYPQVGLTFSQKDVRLAENKVRELTDHKRGYAIFLHKMRNEYDIAPAQMNNGVYDGRLSHVVYDHLPEETLPLYQENDDPSDAIIHVSRYVEKIMDMDFEHAERKEAALANPVVRQTLITSLDRRGERHNHVYYTGRNGRTLEFTFNTFSNQRLTLDGKTARISLAELEKLERIVGGIAASSEQHLKAA